MKHFKMKYAVCILMLVFVLQPESNEGLFELPFIRFGLGPIARPQDRPTTPKPQNNFFFFPPTGEDTDREPNPPVGGAGNGGIVFESSEEGEVFFPEGVSLPPTDNATERQVISAPNINGECPEGMKNVNGRCRRVISGKW